MQLLMQTTIMAKKNSTISIQISVTENAKNHVDAITARTDIPQKRVLSRIFEWFATLPETAQRSILWPESSVDELDATLVALEFLQRRRAEVEAAERAAKVAASAVKRGGS